MATTQQISTLLELPERTARYRLDRLWKLGMCGGRQPYADQGSAPYHWWPSRLADAFHRGKELPRGGEREEPQEQFLRHAAAITGLYVALLRLAPTLGWELLAFAREVEAREEFTVGERQAAIVPDVFVAIREQGAEYHAMVEVDRGTMSIPRLSRKLSLYLAWVASGVWEERHPYVPALLVLTTTSRRVEQVVAKAEERCRAESRTARTHTGAMNILGMIVAATDAVERPEAAVADPTWRKRGGVEGLRLADLLREPWKRWRAEVTERAATVEEADRRREAFLASEELRKTVQALYLRYGGINTYDEQLRPLAEEDRPALELLLHETRAMTGLERQAWRFFARGTILDDLGRPHAVHEQMPMSPEEREAVSSLHDALFARQREFVASLHARYPYLPWVVRAIRELGGGKLLDHRRWWERHGRTTNDLAELKRLQGRALDYLKRRGHRISERRRGANVITRHTSWSERKVARAIDEEQLRACPDCEQLVVPSRDDYRYQVGYCPFCGGRDRLLSITDAVASGLVEPDGEGFWRVRHGPVPGWAEGRPLPPLGGDEEGRAIRVATYTRISTDEDRQPFSLGAQSERLEAYARSQDGWRIVRRFTDQASGATLDRPGLRQALREAGAGVFELLLVYRVDRLSRSVRQLAQTAEELERSGVALRSATEPFDTSSPAGKMMLQMLGVFAEFERATIVERITAGMERAASQGRWVVGSTPFGYVRDRERKEIVLDHSRADVVRRIFRMYAEERMGAEAIAQTLNAEGHRSKNGVPFARPNVLWILRNPVYVGRVVFRGKVHNRRHEAVVDEETYEAVQAILTERGESQALKRGHPSDYLLSGVLRCGRCRKAYVGTAAHGRKSRYRYYICSTRYRYGTEVCDGERLPMEALEDAVVEQISEVFADTALVGEALALSRAEEAGASEESARRLASIQQQLAGARRSLDRYFGAFEQGIMSAADCQERIERLRDRIEALEAEERTLAERGTGGLSVAPTADDVAEWARDLRVLIESATPQQKKALMRLLVKELRVMSREEIQPTYKIPALVRAPEGQVVPTGFEPVSPP